MNIITAVVNRRSILSSKRALLTPPRRPIFSGINKFLDEKLPSEAPLDYSRPSLMVAPVLLTHGVLGSLLSYPVIAEALTRERGIVGSVPGDWDLVETSTPLSLGFMLSGLVSSFFGSSIAAMGPRKALMGSAVCISSGLAVSAVGVYTHTLPLLYFGFGTSVGAGVGLSYASPIQTLMKWFPQNKGVCGGLAASAVGLGAVLSKEGMEMVLRASSSLPDFFGPASALEVSCEAGGVGKVVVESGGSAEVVEVLSSQVSSSMLPGLQEGLYMLGSGGSTGAVQALALLSVASLSALTASAVMIRTPAKGYTEDSSDLLLSPLLSELTSREIAPNVDSTEEKEMDFFSAARTRNFHVLGAMLACTATSGLGLLTLSDAIMTEEFSRIFPELITPSFVGNHTMGLCAAGIFGAGFWSTLSDFVGCRKSLVLMYFISTPAFLALPYCASLAAESGSSAPVFLSIGAGAVAASSLGGVVATMPAYCAELYGKKNVAAVLGGLLAYSTLASTFAPYLYVKMHQLAEQKAVGDLITQISPEVLQEALSCSAESVSGLLQSGAVTLSDLHSLAPLGATDPIPYLYDTTLYTFAGLMAVSALSHSLIREPSGAGGALRSPLRVPLPEKVKRDLPEMGTGKNKYIDRRKKVKKQQ